MNEGKQYKWLVNWVYETLRKAYGEVGWWPLLKQEPSGWVCDYPSENLSKDMSRDAQFEIALGAILTQNTNWQNAERALIGLKKANLFSADAILAISQIDLAEVIRPSGYYQQKARKLKVFAAFWASDREPTRSSLLSLWGLGPETVDDMLLYGFGETIFVIDAYTKRLFTRVGLCDERIPYETLQALLTKYLPNDRYVFRLYHALIVQHAKHHCRKQPICSDCPLSAQCQYAIINHCG